MPREKPGGSAPAGPPQRCCWDGLILLKKIKKENNKTIIVITHDLEEASYADRIIVLNNGFVVADGTPKEVFKNELVLEASGLKTMESVSIIHNLKNKEYKNKSLIEEALWELTFNE